MRFFLPNAIATAVLAQAASQTRAPEHSLRHNLFIYSSDVLHRNLYVSTYVVSLRTVCLAFLRHSRPTRLPSCFVRHSRRPTRLPSCFVNFDPRASLNDFGFQGKPAACHSVSFAPQHHQLPHPHASQDSSASLKTMPHLQSSQHHASSTAPPPHPLLLEKRSDQDP